MGSDNVLTLPFLTRKMLAFEGAVRFSLIVESWGDTTNKIRIQGATKEGPFSLRHIPTGSFTKKTETYGIPDFPIFISVSNPDANIEQGAAFVRVSLAISGDIVHQLVAGLIASNHAISWPQQQNEYSVPTVGIFKTVSTSNPAAGVELSHTVASGTYQKIRSIIFTLVTDATAADRNVRLRFSNFSNQIFDITIATLQTASLTYEYTFLAGHPFGPTLINNKIVIPMPGDLLLGESFNIATATNNLQAGDNFSNAYILLDQFINV